MTIDERLREIELMRQRYGDLEHGPNMDWILIKRFPLPSDWNREHTELLVVIPPGYPATPPDNFYVREGLRLRNGNLPNNYSEGQSVLGGPWAQFSFHAQAWTPTPNPEDGDSLLTFMLGIEQRLEEGA